MMTQSGMVAMNPTFGLMSGQLGIGLEYSGWDKVLSIFQPAVALTSQIFARNNNTQQIAVGQNGSVLSLTPTTQIQPNYYQTTPQVVTNANGQVVGGVGANVVSAGGSIFDGLAQSFGVSTGTFMLGGLAVIGLILWTPGKRR